MAELQVRLDAGDYQVSEVAVMARRLQPRQGALQELQNFVVARQAAQGGDDEMRAAPGGVSEN